VLLGPCPATGVPGYTSVVPNGGQVWLVGSNQTISWFNATLSGPVTIEVSRDSGVHWETIANNILGPPFVWTVTPPVTHHARVRIRNAVLASNPGTSATDFLIVNTLVGAGPEALPTAAALSAPWPNPSAGEVRLEVDLPRAAAIEVAVYDVRGRRIRRLEHGLVSAGRHGLIWNGLDESGHPVAPGLYLARMHGPDFDASRRVIRLR